MMTAFPEVYHILCFLLLFTSIHCESAFNYEINARVSENINGFLTEISHVASLPFQMINSSVVDVSDFRSGPPFLPGSRMFMNIKQMYMSSLNVLNLGFETKLYYAMINNGPFPFGIEMDASNSSTLTSIEVYHLQRNGLPDSYRNCPRDPDVCSFPFDCTKRPWYVQAKAAGKRLWTKPFLQTFPTLPTIAISNPIFVGGKLIGVVSSNVLLGQISDYLKKSYSGTDRNVFVIDKPTGYLIGNSMGASLFTGATPSQYDLVPAATSSDPIISGATQKLIEENWPDHLVIFEDYYLQNVLFVHDIPGVEWYVVVLLPANLQISSVEPSTGVYKIVMFLGVLCITVCVLAICATLYFRNTRLLKLTRPPLSLTILLAGVLLGIYVIVLLGENTNASCTARPWLLNIAFTLAVSPLLVKSYMVNYLFNVDPLSKKKLIPLTVVFGLTASLVCVDAVLMACTLYTSTGTGVVVTTELTSNGAYGQITYCASFRNFQFLIGEIVYKSVILLVACYYSFLIRHIPGTIAGSKLLLVTVYNVTFISGVILLLVNKVKDVPSQVVVQAAGVTLCVVLTSSLLVVPHVYHLLKRGDDDAADEVIAEVFEKKRASDRERSSTSMAVGVNKSMAYAPSKAYSDSTTVSTADTALMTVKTAPRHHPMPHIGSAVTPVMEDGRVEEFDEKD